MSTSQIQRLAGYYWVKYQGKWVVAEWSPHLAISYWYLPGQTYLSYDTDFSEIIEKPLKQPK